jgi:hypothetical protein
MKFTKMKKGVVDPSLVMPDAVWDKVLSNLDPETLLKSKAVSRTWAARVDQNAVKRDDVPVHVKGDELHELHVMSFVGLFLRFWQFAVFRKSTILFDYVKTHHDVARARVMSCIRIYAFFVLVGTPLLVGSPKGAAMMVQFLEVLFLFLPGFLRLSPGVAQAVVVLLTVLLIFLDSVSLPSFVSVSLGLVVVVWSMFLQRLAPAMAGSNLPLFFASWTLPIRSLRFVGWIAVRNDPAWMVLATALALAGLALKSRRFPAAREVVQFGLVAVGASAVCQMLRWCWNIEVLAKSTLLVSTLVWFLSSMPIPWFQNSLFVYRKNFLILSAWTIVTIVAAVAIRRS